MNVTCASGITLDFRNTTAYPVDYLYLPSEWILYQVTYPLLILLGCLSNSSFIWTFARTPSLHTQTFIYLACLAGTDLLTVLTFVPPVFMFASTNPGRYTTDLLLVLENICIITRYGLFVFSTTNITIVTSERFLAICHPIKHRLIKGSRKTLKLICISFIFSFLCDCSAIPFYPTSLINACVYWKDTTYSIKITKSFESVGTLLPYIQVILVVYVMYWSLIVMVNIYMYCHLIRTINKRQHDQSMPMAKMREDQFRQVSIMLISNGTFCMLCATISLSWQILQALPMYGIVILPSYQVGVWRPIQEIVIILNATANPFIYLATNKSYRQAFKESLSACRTVSGCDITGSNNTTDNVLSARHTSKL